MALGGGTGDDHGGQVMTVAAARDDTGGQAMTMEPRVRDHIKCPCPKGGPSWAEPRTSAPPCCGPRGGDLEGLTPLCPPPSQECEILDIVMKMCCECLLE